MDRGGTAFLHSPRRVLRLELFSGGFPRRWAAAGKSMRLYQRRQRRCRRIQRARDGSRLTKAHDKRRRCPKGPRRQKAKCCEEKKLARRAETRHRPRRKERLAKPRRKRPAGVVDAPLARNGAGIWPVRFRLATATCAGLTPTSCRVMGGFSVVDKPLRSLTVAAASADTGICSGCPPSERNPHVKQLEPRPHGRGFLCLSCRAMYSAAVAMSSADATSLRGTCSGRSLVAATPLPVRALKRLVGLLPGVCKFPNCKVR